MNITKLKNNLSVIILCGGKGLRLRPITKDLPKPLITINNKTILENIIQYFLKYNVKNFIIPTGYKSKLIKNFIKKKFKNENIKVVYTGLNSDIISRLNKSLKFSKEHFIICYGDTLVNINLNRYLNFFLKKKNKITIATYQLKSNFGILDIKKNQKVTRFREKPKLDIWFNVGYFIFSLKNFLNFKKFKKFEYLIKFLARKKLMRAYKHRGSHITVNTIEELVKAKKQIKKFNLNGKK